MSTTAATPASPLLRFSATSISSTPNSLRPTQRRQKSYRAAKAKAVVNLRVSVDRCGESRQVLRRPTITLRTTSKGPAAGPSLS
jgi:hypothetical protein